MTKREQRVINALENCVKSGEFSVDYAIITLENNVGYAWVTDAAKDEFYNWLDEWESSQQPEPAVELPGIQQAAGDPEYGKPVEEPEEPEADDMDNVSAPTDPMAYETQETEPESGNTDDPEEEPGTAGETPETEPESENQPDSEESADTVGDEPTAEDTPSEE